jgi:hypothetical protein
MMAVEEVRATRSPVKRAACHATPSAMATPAVTAVASATCSPPPPKITRWIRANCPRENWIPMVNRSRMTPISAAASTTTGSLTIPNPPGPMTIPARRNPTMGTIPKEKAMKATTVPPTRRATISGR